MIYYSKFLVLLIFSFLSVADIKFSSDYVVITIPNKVIASGNIKFKHDGFNITSNAFTYDIHNNQCQFNDDVNLTYLNSYLHSDSLHLDVNKKFISGHSNIIFKSKNITAYSDDIYISNFETLRLKNNVKIERQNSLIKSNELIYNLKTNSIISNKRVKLRIKE